MLEVAEADLELEAGFCPCERRAGHAEIARPSSSTRTVDVPRFAMAGSVASRAASCTELHRSRGTEGSNPCTLQSGYWLVGIVDWPDRAGLPGVAHESPCFEHLERTCTPAGRPRRKSRGRLRFERQYRD